jgi:hypothetical protein
MPSRPRWRGQAYPTERMGSGGSRRAPSVPFGKDVFRDESSATIGLVRSASGNSLGTPAHLLMANAIK